MANRVQLVGGTTAFNAALVGLDREVTVDTTLGELCLHTGGGAGTYARVPSKTANDALYQAKATLLTAVAAVSATDGLIAKTGAATVSARTITGTANQVDVANGGGAGGNPTLSLSSTAVAPGTLAVTGAFQTNAAATFASTFNAQARGFVKALVERATIAATATSGAYSFDVITQAVLYHTSNAAGNFSLNVRGDGSNSLDSILTTGDSITIAFITTQAGTAYYLTALSVDGAAQTIRWAGKTAIAAGVVSSENIYTFTIIKTGSATFKVEGNMTAFG